MRIAKLYMDPQDKQRFEIQGKSSVKYHLKANHQVEAKRWYWALNNAIQWSKDEAKEEVKRSQLDQEALKHAKEQQLDKRSTKEADSLSLTSSKVPSSRNLAPREFYHIFIASLTNKFNSQHPWCAYDRPGYDISFWSEYH